MPLKSVPSTPRPDIVASRYLHERYLSPLPIPQPSSRRDEPLQEQVAPEPHVRVLDRPPARVRAEENAEEEERAVSERVLLKGGKVAMRPATRPNPRHCTRTRTHHCRNSTTLPRSSVYPSSAAAWSRASAIQGAPFSRAQRRISTRPSMTA